MKVIAVNIASPTVINWRGKEIKTGIYKSPVPGPILLEDEDVKGDTVIDRKYHGGKDKACYLFSADHYAHWQKRYPEQEWNWGMFGENITADGFDEADIYVGDILKIGNAVVQVSQPRQPCYKLGVRFGTQKILKDFIAYACPGAYLRVLTPGTVTEGAAVSILEKDPHKLSLKKVFEMLYRPEDSHEVQEAIKHPFLAESCRKDLDKVLKRISRAQVS
ncbi:MOSC domain-containing protein [Sinomicrobium weinanense]|uniref:MOSC domain-containing protein n=1 Tax=Sinomicrobium weinanense TaxID=2842200 RepID=A0A926Q4Z1_9FLAO|nr:MOSC domain-containing protein [Sinomicrobium weinanense]MBC9798519.1 MOSC domain-containing protein [Sinomicrobium weinanense]MBU3125782.1 MOSC domain-containing protein [Sinomicrobium weinanense]